MTPHALKNPTVYVLGVAFTHDMRCAVVIEKKKPEWQAGKLNCVGGKVEPKEAAESAMPREFFEETGTMTAVEDWLYFFTMRFLNGAVVHCYTTRLTRNADPQTMEEEHIFVLPVAPSTGQLITTRPRIRNLSWLIPMAYHQLSEPPEERMIVS
jgi:8-oxo-dGTP pyrophosphatase MutT (NUDIX family)